MTITYVAVGFRVDTSRSIFYFKDNNLVDFLNKLHDKLIKKVPDFVSLRMVKQ